MCVVFREQQQQVRARRNLPAVQWGVHTAAAQHTHIIRIILFMLQQRAGKKRFK